MTNNWQDDRFRQLMLKAQDGDRDSYENLLKNLTPMVRSAVRRRRSFLAHDEVEDLVQDVLLSVHAVRGTYDPERAFMPWFMAIVRNRLADGGRRYARQAASTAAAKEIFETFQPLHTNMPLDEYGDPEALHQAIATLPEGQRKAIELVKIGEMSLKEASHETGMSVTALKVSIHRALKALREKLKKEL